MTPRDSRTRTAFDIGRGDATHIGFGGGMHFCIGAPLARLEIAVSLAQLRAGPDLRLLQPPEYQPFFVIRGLTGLLVGRAVPVESRGGTGSVSRVPEESAPDQRVDRNRSEVLLDVGVPQPMRAMIFNSWPLILAALLLSYLAAVFFPAIGGLLLIGTPIAIVAA